jgi:hypothetical protein
LNSAENRLRVLMVIRPLYRRIHLTGLSQEAGPPLKPLRTSLTCWQRDGVTLSCPAGVLAQKGRKVIPVFQVGFTIACDISSEFEPRSVRSKFQKLCLDLVKGLTHHHEC